MSKTPEKKDVLVKSKTKRKHYTKQIMSVAIVVAIAVLGYKLWQNPTLLNQAKDWFKQTDKTAVYQQQLANITSQMAKMQNELNLLRSKAENPNFDEIHRRIDNIEHISVNTIKSKADLETVLGLIVRMDRAEAQVNNLAKVSDKGALVLTAAMLVKDAAQSGQPFVYEASVLKEIASDEVEIADDVQKIALWAETGVNSLDELQQQLVSIIKNNTNDTNDEIVEADNWKERIYQQVNKVVKIKNTNSHAKEIVEARGEPAWEIVGNLVAEGNIAKAIAIAEKPLNASLSDDADFADWLDKAKAFRDFYNSINRITAKSLAIMKVDALRN